MNGRCITLGCVEQHPIFRSPPSSEWRLLEIRQITCQDCYGFVAQAWLLMRQCWYREGACLWISLTWVGSIRMLSSTLNMTERIATGWQLMDKLLSSLSLKSINWTGLCSRICLVRTEELSFGWLLGWRRLIFDLSSGNSFWSMEASHAICLCTVFVFLYKTSARRPGNSMVLSNIGSRWSADFDAVYPFCKSIIQFKSLPKRSCKVFYFKRSDLSFYCEANGYVIKTNANGWCHQYSSTTEQCQQCRHCVSNQVAQDELKNGVTYQTDIFQWCLVCQKSRGCIIQLE